MYFPFKQFVNFFDLNTLMATFIGLMILSGLMLSLTSCSSNKSSAEVQNSTQDIIQTQQTVKKSTPEGQKLTEDKTPNRQTVFLKIGLMQDASISTNSTRTPSITMPQLENFITLLREHPGELAFGFIDENSNELFIRLRTQPRPTLPVKPKELANPFAEEQARNEYRAKKQPYEERLSKWQGETDKQIEIFKSKVEPLLVRLTDKKTKSKITDVVEGIKRADLFLSETEQMPTLRVLFLITDGLETANPKAPTSVLRSQPKIFLINGSANVGILKNYDVEAVENIETGIRRVGEILAEQNKPLSAAVNPPK